MIRKTPIILMAAAGLIAGPGIWFAVAADPTPQTAPARPPIQVVVTIPPLVGIVKSLCPPGMTVTGLMKPGQSEHGYEFRPSDMVTLRHSDVLVYVGMGLEPQVAKFAERSTESKRQVVVLGAALGLEKAGEKHDPHEHNEDEHADKDHDHHEHHGTDVHVWLDPVLVKAFIPHIATALKKAITEKGGAWAGAEKEVDDKAAEAIKQVEEVHQRYATSLAPLKGKSIVTHHAAFGRLAARYDIKIAEVIRPFESIEPTPGQLEECIKAIRAQNVKTVFVEPQFNAKAAQKIADAAHVKIGTLDPLGDGDWIRMMNANLDSLVKGLSDASGDSKK